MASCSRRAARRAPRFAWRDDLAGGHGLPGLRRVPARLRPHVVWFGEMPLEIERSTRRSRLRLFVSIGTSGQVYPAAGFVEAVLAAGRAHTIELNLEPSAIKPRFAEHRQGAAATLRAGAGRGAVGAGGCGHEF